MDKEKGFDDTAIEYFDIDGWQIELEYDVEGESIDKRFKQYIEGKVLLEKLEEQ